MKRCKEKLHAAQTPTTPKRAAKRGVYLHALLRFKYRSDRAEEEQCCTADSRRTKSSLLLQTSCERLRQCERIQPSDRSLARWPSR